MSVLALIDKKGSEIAALIYPDEDANSNNVNELKIPHNNKLMIANLKMIYIYYLLK
jgi:hypothetical protein